MNTLLGSISSQWESITHPIKIGNETNHALMTAFPEIVYAYGNWTKTPYTMGISIDMNSIKDTQEDFAIRMDDFHGI